MRDRENPWLGTLCAAWTCLFAAGHYGGLFVTLLGANREIWLATTLPALTAMYWFLVALSVLFWLVGLWRRQDDR